MMSWKKIKYKADVSPRLSNRDVDVFTVIVINREHIFEIFRDRELSLLRSDSRVHISVL